MDITNLESKECEYRISDMSIEDRATAYQEYIESNNPGAEAYDFYNAYIAGAADQEKVDIELFCDWLHGHIFSDSHGNSISGDFIKDAYLKYIEK